MNTSRSFKVGVRRKIPYLTNLVILIAGLFFLVLIIFDFFFYPLRNAPVEIQTAVFFWLVPMFWKKLIIISSFGFFTTSLLYVYLRLYKPAILRFDVNDIQIRGKAFRLIIPIKRIRKVYCNDANDMAGTSKERLSILVEHAKQKATAVKLKNYAEADNFMEQLTSYQNLDIRFYDFSVILPHMNEE
jgi:hypothetical protein